MDIKDCTHTVTGTLVKIYEVYEDKVHGAFYNGNGDWIMAVWDDEGENIIPCQDHLDLYLKDWRTGIPWEYLIDKIECVAMDKSGTWCGYQLPVPRKTDNSPWSNGESFFILNGIKMPTPPDWKESLVRRPR